MFPIDPNPEDDRNRRRIRAEGGDVSGFDVGATHDPHPEAPAPRLGPWASRFEELNVDLGPDTVEFSHVRNNTASQHLALIGSAVGFTVFVAVVIPIMRLSVLGNAIWIGLGIVVLALIAMIMHAKVETTRLKLNREGLTIDQGTELDHESIVVLWAELSGVDLEPVSETDGRKGMCLRLRPRTGEAIDTLGGVGVGELNDVRRVINETLARHRERPGRGG